MTLRACAWCLRCKCVCTVGICGSMHGLCVVCLYVVCVCGVWLHAFGVGAVNSIRTS